MQLLRISQIIVAVLLMATILLQNRGAGLSGVFGGGGNVYRTKRGAEKMLFTATIILGSIFIIIPIIELLLKK